MPIFCLTFRNVKSKDEDKLVLYRGEVTISRSLAYKGTFYKYLVVKKGKELWEDLSEFASYYRVIVNRGLKIPEQCIKAGGK